MPAKIQFAGTMNRNQIYARNGVATFGTYI